MLHTLAVWSSEHDASHWPDGSHRIAFTSCLCPWKHLRDSECPSLHTWIILSVEQLAKVSSSRQSTSRVGSLWNANCCSTSPFCASQMIAVLSTEPLSRYLPLAFHLIEKMGSLCFDSVRVSFPLAFQMRARPSYEPVASAEPVWFQSSVVTSLPFSPLDWSLAMCLSTYGSASCVICPLPLGLSGTRQMRAVESPEPDASISVFGFHAQMNTSDVCPERVVTWSSPTTPSFPLLLLPLSAAPALEEAFSERCFLAGGPSGVAPFPDAPSELRSSENGSLEPTSLPSSVTLFSSSWYMMPFCTKLMSWPGGILAPLMLLLATRLSAPKVNAACRKPDSCK
mmetsp:Transcript_12922/g.33105  ORF Transcript_12922/g.33105 Transcript_12922/m.33105 type:complete len:340 (-) Transcript_12922:128-1147(-)